jgi:hypothetical protein
MHAAVHIWSWCWANGDGSLAPACFLDAQVIAEATWAGSSSTAVHIPGCGDLVDVVMRALARPVPMKVCKSEER